MGGLKGCPFCGSRWHAKEFGVYILWHEQTCVFGGQNGVVHSTTMDDLFAIKWNTRASDAAIKELVEALDTMAKVAEFHGWIEACDGRRVALMMAKDVMKKHKPMD